MCRCPWSEAHAHGQRHAKLVSEEASISDYLGMRHTGGYRDLRTVLNKPFYCTTSVPSQDLFLDRWGSQNLPERFHEMAWNRLRATGVMVRQSKTRPQLVVPGSEILSLRMAIVRYSGQGVYKDSDYAVEWNELPPVRGSAIPPHLSVLPGEDGGPSDHGWWPIIVTRFQNDVEDPPTLNRGITCMRLRAVCVYQMFSTETPVAWPVWSPTASQ